MGDPIQNSQIKVTSWNAGKQSGNPDHEVAKAWKDGRQVKDLRAEQEFKSRDDELAYTSGLEEEALKVERGAAETMANLGSDVYLLQETNQAGETERPVIDVLQTRGYEIHKSKSGGQAIAINPHKFTNIQNVSGSIQVSEVDVIEYNAVKAEDRQGNTILFINVQASGIYYDDDAMIRDEEFRGREDLERIIADVRTENPECSIQFVGGDLNTSPERVAHVAGNRFERMKELGFHKTSPDYATNVYSQSDTKYKTRTLDHQFVSFKNSFKARFKRFFKGGLVVKTKVVAKQVLGSFEDREKYDLSKNASDHLPVTVVNHLINKPPLFQRIRAKASSIFQRLGRALRRS